MEKLSLSSRWTLNDGMKIPVLGFGVYQSPPGEGTKNAVLEALKCGYRHIDTASIYANESDVGEAVRESGLPRKEVFVTTKLWNSDQGYGGAKRGFEKSFQRLNIEYIDLYLLHWPVQGKRLESWRALVELKKEGRIKSIGVSNFTIKHLEELLEKSETPPAVNQVEFNPFLYQGALLQFCLKNKIYIEGYCPLTQGTKLSNIALGKIANKYKKTSAQILLRWALQKNTIPLPKSVTTSRIKENSHIFDFEIEKGDMASLDNLNEDLRVSWDPTNAP